MAPLRLTAGLARTYCRGEQMSALVYKIEVPIQGELQWFELCKADSAEAAAEVVRVLLSAGKGQPAQIKITTVYID